MLTQSTNDLARRVLIVEDDEIVAQNWVEMLQLKGYQVSAVNNGEAALLAIDAQSPDAVLMDIGIPRIDGYELARRIRARNTPRRPLLIAITGRAQLVDQVVARDAGIDVHIAKPADPEEIWAALDRLRFRQNPPDDLDGK